MADGSSLSYLDIYCERAGDPGLWGEPLNALTNLCFIVAALLVGRQLLRVKHGRRLDLWFLVLFLFSIGLGSGAYHMHPDPHTLLMDVIPISLFINLYLLSALRRLFGLGWTKVAYYWLLYTALGVLAQTALPSGLWNGTIMYIPTFLTLCILTWAIRARDAALGRIFLQVLGVWALSLAFRTFDPQVCAAFPYGTHFLWHALNAWVLWRLASVLVARVPAK